MGLGRETMGKVDHEHILVPILIKGEVHKGGGQLVVQLDPVSEPDHLAEQP